MKILVVGGGGREHKGGVIKSENCRKTDILLSVNKTVFDFEYIKKQCNITADYNSYQQKEEHIVAECIDDFFNHLSTTL